MDEEIRLKRVGGHIQDADPVKMAQLTEWIEANVRLSQPFTIIVDQYGEALCTHVHPPERKEE